MRPLKVIKINESYLTYDPNFNEMPTQSYYYYIVNIVKKILFNLPKNVHIIIGDTSYFCKPGLQNIKMYFQVEHTLVKTGGRGVTNVIYGNIPVNNEENYLIRIPSFNFFNSLDIVIEYSQPNIHNIKSNPIFDDYLKKVVYLAPLIYDTNFNKNRDGNIMTSFIDTNQDRRRRLLTKMVENKIDFKNINEFEHGKLCELLLDYKILLNIHQTDHHHTLEEIRLVPAISSGMVIISENSPLSENVPYNEHLIWASYDDVIDILKDVSDNYNHYRKKLVNSNLENIISTMREDNYSALYEKILNFI